MKVEVAILKSNKYLLSPTAQPMPQASRPQVQLACLQPWSGTTQPTPHTSGLYPLNALMTSCISLFSNMSFLRMTLSSAKSLSVMENCDFSYASYISVLNACIANLPLPFSIITSKHIFEVGVQILFGFSMKLVIDLFQWESSLTDCVTELHSSPPEKI